MKFNKLVLLLALATPVLSFADVPPASTNAPPPDYHPDDGDGSRNGDVDTPIPLEAVDYANAPFNDYPTNPPAEPPPIDDGKAPLPWPFGPGKPPPGFDPPPGQDPPPERRNPGIRPR